MIKIYTYAFVIYLMLLTNSFAYLDPGTGSFIIQAIVATLAACLATLSFYWNKFKNYILGLISKLKSYTNKSKN